MACVQNTVLKFMPRYSNKQKSPTVKGNMTFLTLAKTVRIILTINKAMKNHVGSFGGTETVNMDAINILQSVNNNGIYGILYTINGNNKQYDILLKYCQLKSIFVVSKNPEIIKNNGI